MPVTFRNPAGVHDTAGRYHHAALIEDPARRLVLSGQVGMAPDGTVPEGAEAQARQLLANIRTILDAEGMGFAHVAKLTAFLTDAGQIPAWRTARAEAFNGHVSASTLLIVAGLADPRFLLEVEVVAIA